MSMLKELRVNGRDYDIYYFTGTVVDEKRWSETEVTGSGGGGGGYAVGGTGVNTGGYVNIRSKTSRYEKFILQNQTGEKSFSFQDWGISCRTGNTLTVVWAIAKGKSRGPFILVYNHDSDDFYMDDEIGKLFLPGRFTLPVLGTNVSWWPLAAIPAAPIVWEIFWAIVPIDIGGLFGIGLFLSPFAGFFGGRMMAKKKGQAAADEYLERDPDGLVQAIKDTRGEAVAAAA